MLLTAEKLTKKFGDHTAVAQLDLNIKENECVALLGPNGAGKTTTLQMLAGLLTPTSGSIRFSGTKNINRRLIGYLPQYPAFFPWMSAKEYLQFAGRLSEVPKKELQGKIEEMLSFAGLEKAKNKRIGGFSGGMKQRLGLAQAMIHEPKLLILDEPVSALDPSGRRDVLEMMNELKKKMAILFSTHVLHDAEQVCDEIVMLKGGKMKWCGNLIDLRKRQGEDHVLLETKEEIGNWLRTENYVAECSFSSPRAVEFTLRNPESRNRLLSDCIDKGLTITHFSEKGRTLEDAYLELMEQ
ncbi:ABC transporter ATP-binding protein [Siminovitchia fortis]|uniref:ABC transporter ATP-binding protein n=1 Tax=Siminovitchia fortis TaxID=254758 RepID=A0A443IR62_9BACI|nr:ABC transporter ATP-binding protein [Siminovitchia fortis]RWR09649.1 ABC transporter ATP-binding protein [Siminovitchia fortis]WHY82272.1 ABC transporter ATP-binding protein [Siminovitchia fortis]